MTFKEFFSADGLSMILPSNIIRGKITKIAYRQNPIQIDINDGKQTFHVKFPNRYLYDNVVGRQKPEVGKEVLVSLNHKNNIKNIEVI